MITEVNNDWENKDIMKFLQKNRILYTTWDDWKMIDELETKEGESKGKLRQKFNDTEQMIKLIKQKK